MNTEREQPIILQDSTGVSKAALRENLLERLRRAQAIRTLILSTEDQIHHLARDAGEPPPKFQHTGILDTALFENLLLFGYPGTTDSPPQRLLQYAAALAQLDGMLADLEQALAERLAYLEMPRIRIPRNP